MIICPNCNVFVKNLAKHVRRNRCKAQHIRKNTKPSRGLRQLSK